MRHFRKIKTQHPAYLYGKVKFDFFGNDDENAKMNHLHKLCKSLQKEFKIAAIPSQEEDYDPEIGAIVFAAVGTNLFSTRSFADKILEYIDRTSPVRILDDDWSAEEIS